jgi:hypothetical protein
VDKQKSRPNKRTDMRPPQHPTRPNRRLALLLVALALHQLLHVVSSLTSPEGTESITLSPVFEVITGAIWAMVFIWLALQGWRSSATTRQVLVLLTVFSLFQILRLAAFAQADYDRQRLPFLVILWLGWVVFWCAVEFNSAIRTGWLAKR